MKLFVGDESWVFDVDDILLSELFAIKSASGLGLKAFIDGISEMDPIALQIMVWLCKTRAGQHLDPSSINFRLGDMRMENDDPAPLEPTTSGNDATPT